MTSIAGYWPIAIALSPTHHSHGLNWTLKTLKGIEEQEVWRKRMLLEKEVVEARMLIVGFMINEW